MPRRSSSSIMRLRASHSRNFWADAGLAAPVGRLDEGAGDVARLDHALGEGDPRLLGETDGRGGAGVGEGDDNVGVDRGLPGQLAAHLPSGLVEGLAAHDRMGPGEVDELEGAHRPPRLFDRDPYAADAGSVDGDDLAGFDLANEVGADHVEGAGLAGDDVAASPGGVHVAEAAEAERPDAERVAGGDQRITGQEKQAICAVNPGQRPVEHDVQGGTGGADQQPSKDLRVTGGDELDTVSGEFFPDVARVDEVAIVRSEEHTSELQSLRH